MMKILVLAGGSDQIALIKELKKRSHDVVLVDYNLDPPARPYADRHIVASTLDVTLVKEIAIAENIEMITTACTDQALLTVAQVSDMLSLPCYISYQTALNVTNKAYMKKILLDNNIPTARFIVTDKIDTKEFNGLAFPIVVKPVDCNSSKGVKKAFDLSDIPDITKEAISLSRTKTAIAEEFKVGKEISADFYIEDYNVKLMSVTSSNKIKNTNSFTITQSCYPAIKPELEETVLDIGHQIAKHFQLKNTPLLVQLIKNKKGFHVLELSTRIGGGSKYKLIEVLSGIDIMKVYVDLILGEKPVVSPQKRVNYALMNYIYCNPGRFMEENGMDKLKNDGIIDDYFMYKTTGMEIQKHETSSDRVAGFLLTDRNKASLIKKLHLCDKNIEILNDKGQDIMIHSLYLQ
ncbi:MAG: ATP-grasp domain-containing protein [Prevotella sp.]|jgi:phosphoribosylamine-glycine ligase|nr:ATP-grasp domain-containing protein [Prevotella sp.]